MPATITPEDLAAINRRLDIRRLYTRRALLADDIAAAAEDRDFANVMELLRDVVTVETELEAYGEVVRQWPKNGIR